MEIDKRITNIWTVTIYEREVFDRVTDESLMSTYQRALGHSIAPMKNLAPTKDDGMVITDDDRAFFERYYRAALAELSAVLARRTGKPGGSIVNNVDDNGMLVSVYNLAMTDNHEAELLPALASHCLEFLIAKVLEKWYGRGADFGSEGEKDQIKHVLHFRRFPIERPGSVF